MLGRKADHRTSPMNRTQLLDPNAMLRGPAPRSNESSQALLAAAPKNLPPASAKQFPTTFASSHGQAERYRGNSQFSIHLNDGFSPICPGEQIYTEFSYNGSGAPIPAVAPYWWVEQVAANGAIKVSYFSAPILIPPTPTPAFYMQAELAGTPGFFENNAAVGDTWALSGVAPALPGFFKNDAAVGGTGSSRLLPPLSSAYPNLAMLNRFYVIVQAFPDATDADGAGSYYILMPYIPVASLDRKTKIQSMHAFDDTGILDGTPRLLDLTSVNLTFCSWVLTPTPIQQITFYTRVKTCLRVKQKCCSQCPFTYIFGTISDFLSGPVMSAAALRNGDRHPQGLDCKNLMCRRPQMKIKFMGKPASFRDETFDVSHLENKAVAIAPNEAEAMERKRIVPKKRAEHEASTRGDDKKETKKVHVAVKSKSKHHSSNKHRRHGSEDDDSDGSNSDDDAGSDMPGGDMFKGMNSAFGGFFDQKMKRLF